MIRFDPVPRTPSVSKVMVWATYNTNQTVRRCFGKLMDMPFRSSMGLKAFERLQMPKKCARKLVHVS